MNYFLSSVKGVNFYGPRSEFIVSGSDCGHIFLWDKETESIVQLLEGDVAGVVRKLQISSISLSFYVTLALLTFDICMMI